MSERYIVMLFDDSAFGNDLALRQLACDTEDAARRDGYEICYVGGDGLLTWVQFDNEADMVVFKLKYMTYHVPVSPWI